MGWKGEGVRCRGYSSSEELVVDGKLKEASRGFRIWYFKCNWLVGLYSREVPKGGGGDCLFHKGMSRWRKTLS